MGSMYASFRNDLETHLGTRPLIAGHSSEKVRRQAGESHGLEAFGATRLLVVERVELERVFRNCSSVGDTMS
jgi:hypothetical protein